MKTAWTRPGRNHLSSVLLRKDSNALKQLLQNSQGGFVVRLLADFADQLAVQHVVVFVQYHNGTGGQAAQRAFDNRHTVVNGEARVAEIRQVLHVFQAFSAAETGLGKRQVAGNAQHHGIVQVVGLSVELAYRSGAGWGVNTWEDVEYFALAGECGQGCVRQVAGSQDEIGGLGTGLRQLAFNLDWVTTMGDLSHEENPYAGFIETNSRRRVNHKRAKLPMAG